MQQVHHRRECSHRLHRRAGSPSASGYFLQLGAGLLSEAKVGLRASQLLLYLLEANLSRACVNCSLLYAVTGTKLQAHEHMTFQTLPLTHDIPDRSFKCSLQIQPNPLSFVLCSKEPSSNEKKETNKNPFL